MDVLLEQWREEEQDRRNSALAARMRVSRTFEEMLLSLASLEGLTSRPRKGAQISGKVAFIV